jgi:hypothetical protein
MRHTRTEIHTILFDYGGIVAENELHNGLVATGIHSGIDPDNLPGKAMNAIHESGYVLGRGNEQDFINKPGWNGRRPRIISSTISTRC